MGPRCRTAARLRLRRPLCAPGLRQVPPCTGGGLALPIPTYKRLGRWYRKMSRTSAPARCSLPLWWVRPSCGPA